MKAKKFYTVWSGNKVGVFKTWEECKKAVLGYAGAQYKSFPTYTQATKALEESYEKHKGKQVFAEKKKYNYSSSNEKPIIDSIAVDAACSGNPGRMEYQGVDVKTKKRLFHHGQFEYSTNNIGEFLALVHALAHMKKNEDKRPIYSDSKIAINWVRNKQINTKLIKNSKNEKSFQMIERAMVWLKENEISNPILKWKTRDWGEIPADFGRK